MEPLLSIIPRPKYAYRKDLQALHVVCWVIANLCRWEEKDWVQEATTNLVSRSVKHTLQNPVLRAMTNISGDSKPEHTDILLDSGILLAVDHILKFKHNYTNQVVAEVLHCLSNITAGTTRQKECVSAAGLFEPVRNILKNGDLKSKKEACHVLRNAVDRDATPEHFQNVVGPEGEVFAPLTSYIAEIAHTDDLEILRQAIETLNIIFSRGNEPAIKALYPFANQNSNVYVDCMMVLDKRNFENLWVTYQRARVDGDDLTPLLHRFSIKEETVVKEQTRKRGLALFGLPPPEKYVELTSKPASDTSPMINSELAKPGFSGSAFVAEQRLRKRIADDLTLMMETYLKAQVEQRMMEEQAIDSIASRVNGIVFAN
ncbi:hypothetical protein HDU96_004855 [Phlyctochytrium bullatum]|nr:hypothetical protein HDU96_004855 [Phlyctochytrium bullatum]